MYLSDSFSLRNGLASNVFVYTNINNASQGFPETLLSHSGECFFLSSGERNRVLGELPLTSNLYLCVQIRCLLFRSEVICWV